MKISLSESIICTAEATGIMVVLVFDVVFAWNLDQFECTDFLQSTDFCSTRLTTFPQQLVHVQRTFIHQQDALFPVKKINLFFQPLFIDEINQAPAHVFAALILLLAMCSYYYICLGIIPCEAFHHTHTNKGARCDVSAPGYYDSI